MAETNDRPEKYSVLMGVYAKENPEYLRLAAESMFNQTVPPAEFVLICDGPLSDGLNDLIGRLEEEHDNLRVIRFDENHGLGYALQVGVRECRYDLIARMDSDDISRPDRCEKELAYLAEHPEISVVGGWIEEFTTSPEEVVSSRRVPEDSPEIEKFARTRTPFNHVTVMLRKADVLAAGNYPNVRYIQDYYLWVAMFIKGLKGHNLQEPLVWVRVGSDMFKRRSGKLYVKIQLDLFRLMLKHGLITFPQYLKSCILRIGSGIAPNWLRRYAFRKILRKV